MASQPKFAASAPTTWGPTQIASFPRLRALAWNGNTLYASRGYHLLRAKITEQEISWQPVARYEPALWRRLSASHRLTFRLCRDGFHALAISSSGNLVAAVPGAIVSLAPGEKKFRVMHKILRGTRPLHITATPNGRLYWGEYFDNAQRDEVHVYASDDSGSSWNIAYTFPKGAVRHVHNIVYDEWENCLWVLTGDNGKECRILKASCNFTQVDTVISGTQQARAVALLPTRDGLYFSSDTPLEQNYIHHLDRRGNFTTQGKLNSSSIYGCHVGDAIFFSTMAEPGTVNPSNIVQLWGSLNGSDWKVLQQWKKDRWPMGLFQYGNVVLTDGKNTSNVLALTTVAIEGADLETSLWSLNR